MEYKIENLVDIFNALEGKEDRIIFFVKDLSLLMQKVYETKRELLNSSIHMPFPTSYMWKDDGIVKTTIELKFSEEAGFLS